MAMGFYHESQVEPLALLQNPLVEEDVLRGGAGTWFIHDSGIGSKLTTNLAHATPHGDVKLPFNDHGAGWALLGHGVALWEGVREFGVTTNGQRETRAQRERGARREEGGEMREVDTKLRCKNRWLPNRAPSRQQL